MANSNLKKYIFYAICCDMGILAKKLAAPFYHAITDALHIEGGIGTSISLIFIVVALIVFPMFGGGTLMGLLQGMIKLFVSGIGSLGVMHIFGFLITGISIDVVFLFLDCFHADYRIKSVIGVTVGSLAASLFTNVVIYRFSGSLLVLYLSVTLCSGLFCGLVSMLIAKKLAHSRVFKGMCNK